MPYARNLDKFSKNLQENSWMNQRESTINDLT